MFTSLLLAVSLTGGQPPANYYPPGSLPDVTAVGQPAQLPPIPKAGTLPAIQEPAPKKDDPAPGSPEASEEARKEGETPPPTKYLIEKSLAETRLGNILDSNGIKIYGWTELSYSVGTASGSNAPVFMNDRANEFLLNQNYLIVEKAIDASKKEFQLGWVTNWILPGSDARTTVVRGLWDDQLRKNNGGPVLYPIDLYQGYFQAFLPTLGAEGTTVKLGRFATHCSYEVVQAVDTPFLSRSYGFQYNPFTHTGIWATTPLNDTWTVSYGLATGSDTFIDQPTNRATFLGQIKWAPKEGKTTVLLNTVITNPEFIPAEAFTFYNVYNLQLIHKFTDKLTYILDATYSNTKNVPNVGNTNWYGAVNYLTYAHTDKVSSLLRAEVFEDTSGFRTGFKGLYTEVTYGVTWKATDSLLIRPSVRYDNNANSAPFEGSQNLFTATMDVIYRW